MGDRGEAGELRDDPEVARWIFMTLLPVESERQQVLKGLARTIKTAHETAPGGWGATFGGKGLRINSGMAEVLVLHEGGAELLCATGAPGGRYKTAPGCGLVHLDFAAFGTSYNQRFASHEKAIRIAGVKGDGSPRGYTWKNAHSPGLVAYVSEALGMDLPNPDYWPIKT